jgi:osmotically-inducible protein OsmY
MTKLNKWSIPVAIAVFGAIAVGSMVVRHFNDRTASPALRADVAAPALDDEAIAAALRKANVAVDRLSIRSAGGIVILRGTADESTTQKAIGVINTLGFSRVANLVKPEAFDDEALRRNAERQLAQTRSLDGCMLKVSCEKGVIRLSGTIHNELQEDVARNVLRTVEGAHDVQVQLTKI